MMFRILTKVLSGNILYFGSTWLMLAFTAKFYSIELMGVMGLSTAICAPLLLLFGLSPRQLVVTNIINVDDRFIGSRNTLLFLLTIFISILSFFYVDKEYQQAFLLFSFFKIFESCYELNYAVLTKAKDFAKLTSLQRVRSIQLFVFIIISLISNSMELSLIGVIIFNIIILAYEKNKFYFELDIRSVFYLIRISGFISLASFVTLVYLNMPRYFLTGIDLFTLGIFTGLVNIVNVVRLVVQSMTQSLLPYLSESYRNNDLIYFKRIINKQIGVVLVISILTVCIFYFLGKEIFYFLYGKNFKVDDMVVYIAITYGLFLSLAMIFNNAATSIRIFKKQLALSLLLLLIMGSIGFLLISKYAVFGAFFILFLCSVIQSLTLAILIKNKIKRGFIF
ncbi:TPA: lipopolysaccharide biosynthesis protein [Vibrio cholerae]